MASQTAFFPVAGVRVGTAGAGIKYRDREDLLIVELAPGSSSAAVFTRNAFCAAPVILAREHLGRQVPRYLLINSGNANAGTGDTGLQDALACCQTLADLTGCQAAEVLPFSTGVIGEPLAVEKIRRALPAALAALSDTAWGKAAAAIMTTDKVPKLVSRRVDIGGHPITFTGIAKGAGMIRPDMATMLAFIATDAAVNKAVLEYSLRLAVDESFNAITVDGDTSTNDACVLMATGRASAPRIETNRGDVFEQFSRALGEICSDLARAIIRDAEGATKLVQVQVSGARDRQEARLVAYAIAQSPLVKTALFAADPNWGRILAAVGRAGVEHLEIGRVQIWLGGVRIVHQGARDPGYSESAGQQAMEGNEISIRVHLGRGEVESSVLTCDLSYDYVRINAEYRT